jgi:hypothetical protein
MVQQAHQNNKEHERGLHRPDRLPLPLFPHLQADPPFRYTGYSALSINKNGTIHAELKTLQSNYVIACDTQENF